MNRNVLLLTDERATFKLKTYNWAIASVGIVCYMLSSIDARKLATRIIRITFGLCNILQRQKTVVDFQNENCIAKSDSVSA